MFPLTIRIHGKHAYYMRFLRSDDKDDHEDRIFQRHIDIYMNAALLGFLHGKKEVRDTEGEFKDVGHVSIFAEQIQKEEANLNFIFRLIMLLEDEHNRSDEERINRAFRDFANREINNNHKENMKVFEDYVRGGITFLYEKISNNAVNRDEFIDNIMKFMKELNDDIIGKVYEVEIESSII